MSTFHAIDLEKIDVADLVAQGICVAADPGHTGEVQSWYRSGNKSMQGDLVNGVPDGDWMLWHEHGLLWQEVTFVHGAMNKKWKVWYRNGAIWIEGHFDLGARCKQWTFNWPNGLPMAQGCFLDDRMSGTWDYWNQYGDHLGQADFICGYQVDCRPTEP